MWQHRIQLYRTKPELGTFSDEGAFVKAKCAYGARAQLKSETGEVRALAPTPLAHPHIPYSVPPPARLCTS